MDEAFGTFLYILISIIILVVTGLRKMKANRELEKSEPAGEENMPDMNNERGMSWEEIFGIPDEEEQRPPAEEPRPDMAAYVKEKTEYLHGKKEVTEKKPDSVPAEEETSVFSSEIADAISRNQISEKQDTTGVFDDTDWQKAIIYSEILSRKFK